MARLERSEQRLTLALPKGRLYDPAVQLLASAGLDTGVLRDPGREMVLCGPSCRFLLARTADVPTFVAEGVAQLGITGKDVLMEQEPDVTEVLDLGLGPCRIAVAGPRGQVVRDDGRVHGLRSYQRQRGRLVRMATKLPHVARSHARTQAVPAQVIALKGNVELAPLVGLADLIVDIVETGGTLKANDLVEMETIKELSARLIANPVSYRLRGGGGGQLVERLRQVLAQVQETAGERPS